MEKSAVPTYSASGVDEELEQAVFRRAMLPWLAKTRARSPLVSSITGLSSGYFATLIHLPPGPPIAITTDGVGTKILLARELGRYEDIGIDVVANNVNDLICVGAHPIALLDYLATDRIEEPVLEQLAIGLYKGAEAAGIAIPGGEIAQIGAMLAAPDASAPMLDLVGTAIGAMPHGDGPDGWRVPLDGSDVTPGDVIIGIPSSGLHSNGYSLARAVLQDEFSGAVADIDLPDGELLVDALLRPTEIYVSSVESLWAEGVQPRGLVHVSGGGLLNLARLSGDNSYCLDRLPASPPIFEYLQSRGSLPKTTMYETFNMGIGFCAVVAEPDADKALDVLERSGNAGSVIGTVVGDGDQSVSIPAVGLVGRGDTFIDKS